MYTVGFLHARLSRSTCSDRLKALASSVAPASEEVYVLLSRGEPRLETFRRYSFKEHCTFVYLNAPYV